MASKDGRFPPSRTDYKELLAVLDITLEVYCWGRDKYGAYRRFAILTSPSFAECFAVLSAALCDLLRFAVRTNLMQERYFCESVRKRPGACVNAEQRCLRAHASVGRDRRRKQELFQFQEINY